MGLGWARSSCTEALGKNLVQHSTVASHSFWAALHGLHQWPGSAPVAHPAATAALCHPRCPCHCGFGDWHYHFSRQLFRDSFQMNQTFLSFTFKSDALPFFLFQTDQGALFCIENCQSIAFDQIDDVIEALKAIKASGAKKQGNGEGKKEDNGQGKVISSGSILPPFNFNTPEELAALLGRQVELRNGCVSTIEYISSKEDALAGRGEVIRLSDGTWLFKDGTYLGNSRESSLDIVKVLAAS